MLNQLVGMNEMSALSANMFAIETRDKVSYCPILIFLGRKQHLGTVKRKQFSQDVSCPALDQGPAKCDPRTTCGLVS